MYDQLLQKLAESGSDTKSALNRFMGQQDFYGKFLVKFLDDDNYSKIAPAFNANDSDASLMAVHTLKGVSGNLGFTALYEATSNTVSLIRAGKFEEARKPVQLLTVPIKR
jgi:HPt (histidine-containing phosphotransfer) domain-containing protein